MPDNIVEFKCKGNIFNLLFADQIHDFLGERIKASISIKDIFEKLSIAWSNTELLYNITLIPEKMNIKVKRNTYHIPSSSNAEIQSTSTQTIAEKIIEEFSGSVQISGKDYNLGENKNFKILKANKTQLKYEEDLGKDIRVHIQNVCLKEQSVDIEDKSFHAEIHIDALKNSKRLLTSMINLPVTLASVESCNQIVNEELSNYFNQIEFKPLISNIYDMATADPVFVSSQAYNSVKQSYKQCPKEYMITDGYQNRLIWGLIDAPTFFEISYYFSKTYHKSTFADIPTYKEMYTNVENFLLKMNLKIETNNVDLFFLYKLMIDDFDKFTNYQIKYKDKTNISMRKIIKQIVDNTTFKFPNENTELFTQISKEKRKLAQKFRKEGNRIIIDRETIRLNYQRIFNISHKIARTKRKTESLLYSVGCMDVYLDYDYIKNYTKYNAFIYKLQIGNANRYKKVPINLTNEVKRRQIHLQAEGGPSVKNIGEMIFPPSLRSIERRELQSQKELFTSFMLKTLGDLSVFTGSFCDGIKNKRNRELYDGNKIPDNYVNFYASMDVTSSLIGANLKVKIKDEYHDLFPYIILERPNYGMSAFLPDHYPYRNEKNLVQILQIGKLEIIQAKEYKKLKDDLEATKNNCDAVIEKLIEVDEKNEEIYKTIDCTTSSVWEILEDDERFYDAEEQVEEQE